jgi:cytochrome o ubiquinol oxidase subunit II
MNLIRTVFSYVRQSQGMVLSLLLLLLPLLTACSDERSSFLNPAGPIAAAQRTHLIEVVAWTMIAVLPVFILVPLILWRYRYSNKKARYAPGWQFSAVLDLVMWMVPLVIVSVLSMLLWKSTRELDPYQPIASVEAPLEVQVVGLNWKWLFIYPEQGIATVNELAIPVGASVSLELTTDTVMQSFIIPALAGQIYAMPGMRTRLHVLADAPGRLEGENTQFNGVGFTTQKFSVLAQTSADFAAWIATVKKLGVPLDTVTYGQLAVASTGAQAHDALGSPRMPDGVIYFDRVVPGLFGRVLRRYSQGSAVPPAQQPGAEGYIPPAAPEGERQ